MISWLGDAYRGYLWPYLTFLAGVGGGTAIDTHSWWHYAAWPCLAAAVFAAGMAQSRIKKAQR